jgi:hypothetical protein
LKCRPQKLLPSFQSEGWEYQARSTSTKTSTEGLVAEQSLILIVTLRHIAIQAPREFQCKSEEFDVLSTLRRLGPLISVVLQSDRAPVHDR